MILVDAALWPAHGTSWAHLVSDLSRAELHRFAVATGLPARSFERDHYDIPLQRRDDLIRHGASPVPRRELIRRLAESGLRFSKRDSARLHADLLTAWLALLPDWTGANHVGQALLARWSERGRIYHDVHHLAAVLGRITWLGEAASASHRDQRLALIAAWFHDAVHSSGRPAERRNDAGALSDEEASARLAEQNLAPAVESQALTPEAAVHIAELVRMTAHHNPTEGDVSSALLADADLAILGAPPERYDDYAAAIRVEYADIPDDVFVPARVEVLTHLLNGNLYATAAARSRWDHAARANLEREINGLTTAKGGPESG